MSTCQAWYLYVVECADGTLYTGISTDVARRIAEHNAGRGARYTAARRPVSWRAAWRYSDRPSAMQAEHLFKRRGRRAKERAIAAREGFRDGIRLARL